MTPAQLEGLHKLTAARQNQTEGLTDEQVMARAMNKIAVGEGGCFVTFFFPFHTVQKKMARQMMQQSGINEQDVLRQAFQALRTGNLPPNMVNQRPTMTTQPSAISGLGLREWFSF